jgi:hypothetical protein
MPDPWPECKSALGAADLFPFQDQLMQKDAKN